MKTGIHTPKDLFLKPIRYTIPIFQRPYVWTQEDQWAPLWENVRNVAEDCLDKLREFGDGITAINKTEAHFLGAIVIQQLQVQLHELNRWEVIDGQQRMTTLQLLLDSIRQVFTKRDLGVKQISQISSLVWNDRALVDNEEHIFKLWPTSVDQLAYRRTMDQHQARHRGSDDPPRPVRGLSTDGFEASRIVQAHDFFQLQVEDWLDNASGSVSERACALEAAATVLLQLVVIELDRDDDPNVIFETLNARGTPLEQSDLVKNFVVSKADNGQIWEVLNDSWWKKEQRQGRLYRPRLDILLNYWLSMRTGSDVAPLKIFPEFKKYAASQQIGDVMSMVTSDLNRYRDFEEPDQGSVFRERTRIMQTGVITPALILLLSCEYNVRDCAFRAIESFLVRRMLCRQTTKSYGQLMLEASRRLIADDLRDADRVVVELLKEQTAYATEWPKDEAVRRSLETSPLYRLLTRGRLRMVLEGIEDSLRSSMTEDRCPRSLTIEHLMPVSWEANYPLPDGADETAVQERNQLVHSMGNLTLLTKRLNSSLSNGPWDEKREALREYSVLELGKLSVCDVWDEDAIRARSRRMAEVVNRCWPGPESEKWQRA